MIEPQIDSKLTQAEALLSHYGFDMKGYPAQDLVKQWQQKYQASWIRLAIIESLYQGRYKAISVQQILQLWQRKDQANYHFNHEFEALICRKLPRNLTANPTSKPQKIGAITCLVPPRSKQYKPSPPLKSTTKGVIQSNGHKPSWNQSASAKMKPVSEEEKIKVDLAENNQPSPQKEISQRPIDQFTPLPDGSEFYLKLKEVAKKEKIF